MKYFLTFLIIAFVGLGILALRHGSLKQDAAVISSPAASRAITSGDSSTNPPPAASSMLNSFQMQNQISSSNPTVSNPAITPPPTTINSSSTSTPTDLHGGGGGKASISSLSRTLYPFSKNNPKNDVVSLQNFLIQQGYLSATAKADGAYGNMTKQAVMKFQKAHGISQTGNVGPITLSAINSEVDCAASGGTTVKCQRGFVN